MQGERDESVCFGGCVGRQYNLLPQVPLNQSITVRRAVFFLCHVRETLHRRFRRSIWRRRRRAL